MKTVEIYQDEVIIKESRLFELEDQADKTSKLVEALEWLRECDFYFDYPEVKEKIDVALKEFKEQE